MSEETKKIVSDEKLGSKPEEFYDEHQAGIKARDKAIEWAADTQHRLDNDPLLGQDLKNDIEFRAEFQEKADKEAQHAINRVDANLWRSQLHYNQNNAAYHEQAVRDAEAEGVKINFGSKAK